MKNMVFKMISSLLLFFTSLQLYAYIPNVDMIIKRSSETHGYGYFMIDQEVIFPAQPTPYIVKEQWIVEGHDKMRLHVRGERELEGLLDITYVYNGRKRYFIDNSKKMRVNSTPNERSQDYLVFRDHTDFSARLKNLNIIVKKPNPETNRVETAVRLARAGGSVDYAIGDLTSFGASTKNPGIWIEQDLFYVRKVRFPTQAEFTAKEFIRQSRGLFYPKHQSITFNNQTVTINLRRVQGISASSENKMLLSSSSLNPQKNPHVVLKVPDIEIIKEFYARFR